MKLAHVYFSYQKDLELLNLSLDNLEFLRKYDDIDVYVVDDALNPMDKVPENVNYSISTFPRNGNLNGIECLSGMVDIFLEIIQKGNYDWVVKVDCDTIINSWKPFRNADPNKYVQIGTYNPYHGLNANSFVIPFGTVHGYSKIGLENIKSKLDERYNFWKSQSNRFPEDVMGARIACNNDENLNFYITNYVNNPLIDNTELGLYQDYVFSSSMNVEENIPLEMLTNYSSITFKQTERRVREKETIENIRHTCSSRMSEYVRLGLNKMEKYQ